MEHTLVVRGAIRRRHRSAHGEESVLLVRRAAADTLGGQLELPGGKADRLPSGQMEDPRTALTREVREETGLEVSHVGELLDSEDTVSPSGKPVRILTFAADADGELTLSDEHDQAIWYQSKHSLAAVMTPNTARAVAALG